MLEEQKSPFGNRNQQGKNPTFFRLEVRVFGKVQGVSFRTFATREAQRLGLTGTVSNATGGGVSVVAEGDRTALQSFLSRLRQGPSDAEIERIEEKWAQGLGRFSTFDITNDEG